MKQQKKMPAHMIIKRRKTDKAHDSVDIMYSCTQNRITSLTIIFTYC